MVSPEVMGRNGNVFLCPPLPAFDGRPGSSGSSTEDNGEERDSTQPHRSCSPSLTNQYPQQQLGNASVGLMILNATD